MQTRTSAIDNIATAAETAVRTDYRAGLLPTDSDRYEAAQAELAVRAEHSGTRLSPLQLKTTAAQVATNAVR